MSPLDRAVIAERAAALERHLQRVQHKLPPAPGALTNDRDAADSVILHLWQATQIVIDVAVAACAIRRLGTPESYADAFRRLESAGLIEGDLASRLVRAAGFRNLVAHAYDTLDIGRVHAAASTGPGDLRAFMREVLPALLGG